MNISTYAQFCAPTALAVIMGVSRIEAAEFLAAEGAAKGNGATDGETWSRVLEDLGGVRIGDDELRTDEDRARWEKARDDYYAGRRRKRPGYALSRPTVAEVLRRYPEGTYVVTTTAHTLVVRDGEVFRDTMDTGSQRARVAHLYRFPDDLDIGLPDDEAREIEENHERIRAAKERGRERRKAAKARRRERLSLDSMFRL